MKRNSKFMTNDLKIFSLGSNDNLAEKISKILKIKLSPIIVNNFSDGEQNIQLGDNCRNKSVFLIQSTGQPDSNFTRLALAIDAARRASAKEITAVIPYFGYSRQERKSAPRTPISARVFATILETLGVDRVLTMDLHAAAIEGFFLNATVDHLYARPEFIEILKKDFKKEIKNDDIVIVAPDTGAANRARGYGIRLLNHPDLAIISKGREKANTISSMELVGDVKGKVAIMIDDIADTCGTLVKAAELLKSKGAKKVVAVITHGIFSGDARQKLENSKLDMLYVADTLEKTDLPKNIKVVSMDSLFAEAIKRIGAGESLSAIFEK